MFDAMDVARRLIRVGYDPVCPDESVLVCPLRLQKLLYYSQGWALGVTGRPMFRQPLEAWTYGPVVSEVFEKFRGKRDGITPEQAGEPTRTLTTADVALLDMVWREYARYTPRQLIHMTHSEPAWCEARGNLPPEMPSSQPLSHTTMANYFRELARKRAARAVPRGFPTIDPVAVWLAEEELERTGATGTPAADVFGKLLAEAGE